MKKVAILAAVAMMGVFAVGCEKKTAPVTPPKTTTPAPTTTTPPPAPAPTTPAPTTPAPTAN
jgi:serine/threonine-protein kinase